MKLAVRHTYSLFLERKLEGCMCKGNCFHAKKNKHLDFQEAEFAYIQ